MLNKEQHIQFWKKSADEDWDTAVVLLNGKRYGFCLFSLHLVIEKLVKAVWLKENVTNTPPFTHDLVRLAEESSVELTAEQLDFLSVINSWNIRGRYPDFTNALHHSATPDYVKTQMQKINEFKEWLEKKDIEKEIEGYLNALTGLGFPVERAILFGSMAKGNPHAYSDIDLAVWSKAFTNNYFLNIEKTASLKRKFKNIELHPFTENETADTNPFIEEIEATGKIITLQNNA